MLQRGTNIMANQVKTPMQNYFEKVLYGETEDNNSTTVQSQTKQKITIVQQYRVKQNRR